MSHPTAALPDATVSTEAWVREIGHVGSGDLAFAGGKGANLGELTGAGLAVPSGFVIGAPAFDHVLVESGLGETIERCLEDLESNDPEATAHAAEELRELIHEVPIPEPVLEAVRSAYTDLVGLAPSGAVAVRSSATAEDSPTASFAGMNETFLNVIGEDALVEAVRSCWASLYGARAIAYRRSRGIGEAGLGIAVVVQRQINSAVSGVMFTVDPASGDPDKIVIEASFGLGENVVSGQVTPDRFTFSKARGEMVDEVIADKDTLITARERGGVERTTADEADRRRAALSHQQATAVAHLGAQIEAHYDSPQDTEWAVDDEGRIWMLQARPVTATGAWAAEADDRSGGEAIVSGLGAAPGEAVGVARVVTDPTDAERLKDGEVLVARMTAPDWAPAMRRAAAIVTDMGGMTCHAAIVAREFGVPCIVGTREATERITDGERVLVDAYTGRVLPGDAAVQRPAAAAASSAPATPVTATSVLLNVSEPSLADRAARTDADGVGLLRAELMILEALGGRHPKLVIEEQGEDALVKRLSGAIGQVARAFAPRPVTYRTYDFRSNEFRGLAGGDRFEPEEANPMIGYRGALRYSRDPESLRPELRAIARLWDEGVRNLHVMIPFVRTPDEFAAARDLLDDAGLMDRPGFELWVMAEVPSVLFHLPSYAELGARGISIGSNDLTQLMLGADRDSELLADTFDERDHAVVAAIEMLIRSARELGLRTSICGQAPSVHPGYADLLVRVGIDAISVTIDALDRTRRNVAAAERRLLLEAARRQA
ncbi:MAG: phosphoenolpyruvate synthase [Thermoleophilia bacterium]|nr:phosphoenolpyruvate synthase [Thermoleophilia bacterium]